MTLSMSSHRLSCDYAAQSGGDAIHGSLADPSGRADEVKFTVVENPLYESSTAFRRAPPGDLALALGGSRRPPMPLPKPTRAESPTLFEGLPQSEVRKSPPPTPPKPSRLASRAESRSPSPDTAAPFARGGPQPGASLAAAAAALARQRHGV